MPNYEYANIDEYIAQFEPQVQQVLGELRRVINEEAPQSVERIAYGMPTFSQGGNLVHFAAFKRHYGFYPGASGVEAFADRLQEYKTSKGTIQFPADEPLPYELIREIVRFRVSENASKLKK